MQEVKDLLNQVTAINRKYEGIGRITGENFNIFKLLGVASSEVRTHSTFLAELLNPKGSHQQEVVFLDLFVKRFSIQGFDAASATAEVELYIGTKTETTGGRIDILVRDKNNRRIIVENKIYARDQENQLLRYFNYDNAAKLFYLTLNGDAPSSWSTGGNLKESDYIIISYKHDVLGWLEDCKKEAVNLPILRETITQYIHLVKDLTNQTNSGKMQQEMIDTIMKDKESLQSYFLLSGAYEDVLDKVISYLHESLKLLAAETGLKLIFDLSRRESNTGFSFVNDLLDKNNLAIRFEFDGKGTKYFFFGLVQLELFREDRTPSNVLEKFVETFGEGDSTAIWPAWAWLHDYYWWDNETYLKIYNGELIKQVEEKIRKVLSIVGSLQAL